MLKECLFQIKLQYNGLGAGSMKLICVSKVPHSVTHREFFITGLLGTVGNISVAWQPMMPPTLPCSVW
jgi:hypothetical protein